MLNSRTIGKYIVVIIGFIIGVVTLTPNSEPIISPVPMLCIACGTYGGVDFLLNVVMFIPFGIGLYLFTGSWRKAAIFSILATVSIELLQVDVVANRDAGLSDVLANSIGGMFGALLAKTWKLWIVPSRNQARILYIASLVLWASVVTGSALLLKPTVTSHSWWAQVRPVLEGLDRFPGMVRKVVINDREIARGRIDDAYDFKGRFGSAEVSVDAEVTFPAGVHDSTSNIAPITAIFDEAQKEIMMLGQNGRDLLFRSRTLTSALRLREPTFSLTGSFDDGFSDKRIESARRSGYTIWLSSTAADTNQLRSIGYNLHPFMLWNAVLPFYINITPAHIYLSMLWGGLLMFLPGYWAARGSGVSRNGVLNNGVLRNGAARINRAELTVGAIFGAWVLAVLLSVPTAIGMAPVPLWGWMATVAGFAVGYLVGRVTLRG